MSRVVWFCILPLVACGNETVRAPDATDHGVRMALAPSAHEVAAVAEDDAPSPISRFAPSQGLAGTHVRIVGTFPDDHGQLSVTIGGAAAEVVEDGHVLEVVVPHDAQTGPLCVTFDGTVACGGTFTLLTGPVLYGVDPQRFAAGSHDAAIVLTGDGFQTASQVLLNDVPLQASYVSTHELHATLPASFLSTAGDGALTVFTRCASGKRTSEPVLVVVE